MKRTRLRDLRGLIVPAVADTCVLMTLVTRVFQAFANSPSLNRLFGSVTVAKVMPHVPATGTALRRANASGLLHPAEAVSHENAAADLTGYRRTASQRQGYLAQALATETKQELVKHRPRRALRVLTGMVSKLLKAQFEQHVVQIKNSGLDEPSATQQPAKLRTTGLSLTSAPRFGLCALEARVLEDACYASSTLDGGMRPPPQWNVR